MTLLKPLIRAGKAAAKETRKNKPFFSAVDKAALELARPKGTGKEFMTELRKVPGVKPAEIQHRKLERIEALPKMEKADFLKQLEENPPVNLDEMQFLEDTPQNRDLLSDERFGTSFDELRPSEAEEIEDQMATYSQYKTPGGENYREIVLQMPSFGGQDLETLNYLEAMERREGIPTDYGRENLARLRKKRDEMGNVYRSSHWDGVPNVLAHMRVQDRTGPSGEKILHVEEIQSDWHQAGRKKGYVTGDSQAKIDELTAKQEELKALRKDLHNRAGALPDGREDEFMSLMDQANDITPQVMKMQSEIDKLSDLKRTGVPDAPFKKNWHELAMKRLINYAAENGYDSIAITPGMEQAKRYDLSHQISRVVYSPETEMLNAFDLDNKSVIQRSGVKPDQIADYIGKDPAQRLFDEQNTKLDRRGGKDVPYQEISGLDLKVGGEGMQGFYDKMLPEYLNSFGKKYGSQVEIGGYKLQGDPSLRGEASERLGLAGQRFDEMTPEEIEAFNAKLDESNAQQLHHFKITPEMREEVTSQGMPLYQKVGVPLGTGAAGAEMEVPQPIEEVEQVEEPAYAFGGKVKVHVSDNPDVMFMELHDKMFKRK